MGPVATTFEQTEKQVPCFATEYRQEAANRPDAIAVVDCSQGQVEAAGTEIERDDDERQQRGRDIGLVCSKRVDEGGRRGPALQVDRRRHLRRIQRHAQYEADDEADGDLLQQQSGDQAEAELLAADLIGDHRDDRDRDHEGNGIADEAGHAEAVEHGEDRHHCEHAGEREGSSQNIGPQLPERIATEIHTDVPALGSARHAGKSVEEARRLVGNLLRQHGPQQDDEDQDDDELDGLRQGLLIWVSAWSNPTSNPIKTAAISTGDETIRMVSSRSLTFPRMLS